MVVTVKRKHPLYLMMRYKYSKGPVETKVAAIIALALIWMLLLLLMDHPDFIEHWYSTGLYLFICKIFHPVCNVFPFSVGDVFYIVLIAYILYALFRILKYLFTKKFKSLLIYLLKLTIGFQILLLAFYLFWGLNYFRESAAKRLDLQDTSYTFDDIKAVTALLIDSANAARTRVTVADLNQSDNTIYQTAVNAVDAIAKKSAGFPAFHPGIKASLLTYFMNYMGTAGYFNPFTSETQMDYQMPIFLKPFTACHEMSHQMGFGAEDEADFGGFVTGVASDDRLLRYSAYYAGVQQFMSAVFRTDSMEFKKLKTKISPQVRADFKTDRLYWKSFEGKAGIFSSILYDHYLKSNNQPQGLKTYNQMIRLVMAWYRKRQRTHSIPI